MKDHRIDDKINRYQNFLRLRGKLLKQKTLTVAEVLILKILREEFGSSNPPDHQPAMIIDFDSFRHDKDR